MKIGGRAQNFSKFYSVLNKTTAKRKYEETFFFLLYISVAAKISKMAFNVLRQLATRSPIAMRERIALLAPSILHANAMMMWKGGNVSYLFAK